MNSNQCFYMDLYEHGREQHRLLSTLLSIELSVDEKLGIIETEYSIQVDDRIREDVSAMCNLSQGILEKGEARGEARNIINMHRNGFTMEQIVLATNKKVEEIEAIIEENESVWCN